MGYKGYIIFSSIPRYSQMQTTMPQYYRKRKRTSGPSKSRKTNKRTRIIQRRRKFGGYLKTVRWSTRDAANQCHFQWNGTASGTAAPSSTTFNLSDTAATSDFTNLFDTYRIRKVLYRWVCRRDPNQTTTNPQTYPRMSWVHDFNDQVISSAAELRQYANLKEVFFNENYQRTRWYTLNPATLPLTYESGLASRTGPTWGQWLDARNSASVPYYGLKFCADGAFTNMVIHLEAKFVLEFKGVS